MVNSVQSEVWCQFLKRQAADGSGWCVTVFRDRTARLSLADQALAAWRTLPADELIRELEEMAHWLRQATGARPAACARCRGESRPGGS